MSEDVNAGGQAAPENDGGLPESVLTAGVTPEGDNAHKTATELLEEQAGQKKESDPAVAVPEKPEGYALKFNDGVEVDQALLGDFQKTAHELKLTAGQAQKLAELYATKMAGGEETFRKAQMDAVLEAERGWVNEIKGKPTYKEDLSHAQRALAEFGSPELFDIINDTRIGSHPTMFDFMAKVGRALAEPAVRGQGTAGAPEVPLYKRMWPND